jgi:hypothetical protein
LGDGETTEWINPWWDNFVNIQHYASVSDFMAFPLCGFATNYALVESLEDGSPGDLLTNIDFVYVLDEATGTVTIEMSADDKSLNNTYLNVHVQAWYLDADGVECCYSYSDPF